MVKSEGNRLRCRWGIIFNMDFTDTEFEGPD